MKKLNYLFLILLLTTSLLSCKKDEETSIAVGTITEQVSTGANYTLIKSSVIKSKLDTILNGDGPFTVFTPTDNAFMASGVDQNSINSLSEDRLKTILLYHTINGKQLATDLPAGPNEKIITAGGDSIFVTRNSNGVFVNGTKVTKADILASNGVIHELSKILMPPAGNLVEVVLADTSFSFLAAAVIRASQGGTNVVSELTKGSIYTIFAPINDAFRNAGFLTINAINQADPNTLASILTYHVLAGRIFSSDLSDGITATAINSGELSIGITSTGATVKGTSNTTAANITTVNMMASNGVIHVIDKILLK